MLFRALQALPHHAPWITANSGIIQSPTIVKLPTPGPYEMPCVLVFSINKVVVMAQIRKVDFISTLIVQDIVVVP
jgi:hypothetical protein